MGNMQLNHIRKIGDQVNNRSDIFMSSILSFDSKIDGMKLKENISEDLVYIFNM